MASIRTPECPAPAAVLGSRVVAVAGKIGAPVHLVGHSFGGVVALATALAGAVEVLSIATFEANHPTL